MIGNPEIRKKSMAVNAVLNVIRQGLGIVFPLITYPYALRVLGVENIGKVNYATSIVSYFSLIAALGINTYAIREGSKRRGDKKIFNTFANEIFTINLITTAMAYILLIICLFSVKRLESYRLLILLSSVSILLTTFGVDWVNTIFEDFLVITIRSICSHVFALILLFVLVHDSSDYYLYTLVTVSSNFLTCLTNIFYCRRYVHIKITMKPHIGQHIGPMMVLFANSIAISIYVNSDTTMLGWFKGDYYVGLYAVAVKIYTIIKNVLTSIYSVTTPRLSNYGVSEDKEPFKKLITDLWSYLSLLLIPCSVGLMCIAPEIMVIFGGSQYTEAATALQILSISLIFAIFGGIVTVCLNVPLGREKENLMATILAAIINFILNLGAIQLFSQNGAAITTVIAEAFVFFFCYIRFPDKKSFMDSRTITKSIIHACIGAIAIFIYANLVRNYFDTIVIRLVVIILGSIILYTVFLLLMRDKYFKSVLEVGFKKIKRR